MSIISLSNVSYSQGARELFESITLAINPGERTALVGLNGAGKSTLLKLISGEVEADSGTVARQSGCVIEYVPQMLPEKLRNVTLIEALANKLPDAHRFAGYEYLVEQRLIAAGFSEERHSQTLGSLSGGEVNRAMLARALVNEPDLVLLDEPTNHMDIDQVAAFERFITEELIAAALIVSHDRELLDAVTTRTFFLRDRKIHAFGLPFSAARDALAAHDTAAYARRESEERELARLRESAKRLAEWGKVYSNEKFSYRAKSMQKRIAKLETEVTSLPERRRATVALGTADTGASFLVDITALPLSTPDGRFLRTIERLAVRRGERLAIVGSNGCGKSTLIRAIVSAINEGGLRPELRFNPTIKVGYYDQELAHFGRGERVAEAVSSRCVLAPNRVTAELVEAGFAYQRHEDLVSTLSGGERARLTFLIIKLMKPNLLVLDEPTNHLDVEGIEQLEETLVRSDATVIFVSHDRMFLERVASRVEVLMPAR